MALTRCDKVSLQSRTYLANDHLAFYWVPNIYIFSSWSFAAHTWFRWSNINHWIWQNIGLRERIFSSCPPYSVSGGMSSVGAYILKASLATPTIPQKNMKMAKNGPNMTPNGLKWPKNDLKWPKNGPNMTFWCLGVPTLNLCTNAEVYSYQNCLQLWKYPQRVASGKKPQKKYSFFKCS